ncbi:MAG: helix-turn-helix domain-containing protein, partial [Pseudomonas aeruginosa]|nr:helix-turn-helix domain-containing protein [Pseudomonas aeruginosa]
NREMFIPVDFPQQQKQLNKIVVGFQMGASESLRCWPSKGLRIVALDLPTSHQGMQDTKGDEFTSRMLGAINSMLVEMMAAIARKDYEQRRERQAQGIEKARAAGKYQGRPVDADLHKRVKELLEAGLGIRATARHANCSTTTVHRIKAIEK